MKIYNRPLMRVDGFFTKMYKRSCQWQVLGKKIPGERMQEPFLEKKERKTWKKDYLHQNQ